MRNQEDFKKGNRDLININESDELQYWADKLGVTNLRLKAAVNVVGNSAIKVEAYLNRGTAPGAIKK